ncbi:hypothetical protein P3G55_04835 [Leptospira sp. 96542]|nr:hypothetical protein [Leptospira sp. 96542]
MKQKKIKNSVSGIKKASRIIFALKPTKIKPSGKLYSRKKKDLSGILIFSFFKPTSIL